MSDAMQNLGARVVEAARLAVAMHLYQSAASFSGQRVQIGGAGLTISGAGRNPVTDDVLPHAPLRDEPLAARSTRFADGS
jgi:hypothetical protein